MSLKDNCCINSCPSATQTSLKQLRKDFYLVNWAIVMFVSADRKYQNNKITPNSQNQNETEYRTFIIIKLDLTSLGLPHPLYY